MRLDDVQDQAGHTDTQGYLRPRARSIWLGVSTCPWSGKRLRKLGECIRDGLPVPEGVPGYDEVMRWYNDVAVRVQSSLQGIAWAEVIGTHVEITSRAKTIDTLRQKLQRDHNTPLPSIQDLAGVRIEAEMNLDEQDKVAEAVCASFPECAPAVHDLRSGLHSGYRAVHVWLRADCGRAEIQIRTHIQGAWANTYEAAADALGRDIRYGVMPDDPQRMRIVTGLQRLSLELGANIEGTRTELERIESSAHGRASGRRTATQNMRRMRRDLRLMEEQYQIAMGSLRDMFIEVRS